MSTTVRVTIPLAALAALTAATLSGCGPTTTDWGSLPDPHGSGGVSASPDAGSDANGGGEGARAQGDDAGGGGDTDGSAATDSGAGTGDAGNFGGVFGGAPPYVSQSGPSGSHNAGRDCIGCHSQNGDGPSFEIAGTVYDAKGNAAPNVEVRLVDGKGGAFSIYSGDNGNFYKQGPPGSWVNPAHIGVRNATAQNEMLQALTNGSCNSCHCATTGCVTTPVHLP